eukprot:15245877-Alexandrium_andersonii.AAC.1
MLLVPRGAARRRPASSALDVGQPKGADECIARRPPVAQHVGRGPEALQSRGLCGLAEQGRGPRE